MTRWTDDELERVRLAYQSWPPQFDLLPERSRSQVINRASLIGVSCGRARSPITSSPESWAYFAGILDGEGTLYSSKTNHNIIITNTSEELIDWCLATFPGGTKQVTLAYGNRQTIFRARWGRRHEVLDLLNGVLPYLIIKRQAAELMTQKIQRKARRG